MLIASLFSFQARYRLKIALVNKRLHTTSLALSLEIEESHKSTGLTHAVETYPAEKTPPHNHRITLPPNKLMSLQSSRLKEDQVPLSQIRRPIPPVLDQAKIDAMASTLQGLPAESTTCKLEDITAGELPPIDVFLVREEGKSYYFAFGGCHRFQAYEKMAQNGDPMVKVRLLPATRKTLRVYLGSSVDEMFN